MIIFSDLHLDRDSADVCLNEILPGICKAALNSDRHVVFLGDWWHLRYRVDVRLQVAVRDELLRWSDCGVRCQILVGNHDQVNVLGRNALEVFSDLPNVQVFSKPAFEPVDYTWLPYRKDMSEYTLVQSKFMGRTVFVHATEGLDPSHFVGARVFAGHYHKRQSIDAKGTTIWYVGSPRQVTAAEAGQPKGFCAVEGNTVTFVDTNWGPKYHRVELEQGQQLDLSGVAKGDDVRVTVGNEAECARIGAQLDALGVRHTVTPRVQPAEVRHVVDSIAGLRGYAGVWVREHAQDADRAMQVFDSLVGYENADR
jgi:DNA repair exonuclease SbcCD nuclease subunit